MKINKIVILTVILLFTTAIIQWATAIVRIIAEGAFEAGVSSILFGLLFTLVACNMANIERNKRRAEGDGKNDSD